ncbi:LacI family DNA-binding transcriptional regulator [Enterobacteriaceae bacterium LUAb1]
MAKSILRRITRADVAKVAGTSVAVVSYVINNGPRPVAEMTRRRVLDAIKQTGYRPNGIARALASGCSKTYGLVVPNISNPFIASLAHALQQEALNDGQIMLLGDAGDDDLREKELLHNLLAHPIDGLFYTSVDRHPYIDLIQATGTPLVMLDRVDPGLNVSVLCVDERSAAYQVTEHLLSHGYQTAGMIAGPATMLNTQDRLAGWRDAMAYHQLPVNEQWIFHTSYTRQGGYEAAQRMLASTHRPRALFCSNEGQAIGVIRALAERGMQVPQDVALVCLNGTEQAFFHVPRLTTACQPIGDMAKTAIAMLKTWDGRATLREFSYELQIGESCGCAGADHINQLQ